MECAAVRVAIDRQILALANRQDYKAIPPQGGKPSDGRVVMGAPETSEDRMFMDWSPVPNRVVIWQINPNGFATFAEAAKPVINGVPTYSRRMVQMNLIEGRAENQRCWLQRWYGWDQKTRTVVVSPVFRVSGTFQVAGGV